MGWKWDKREQERMAVASAEWTAPGRLATRVRRAINDVDVALGYAAIHAFVPDQLAHAARDFRGEAEALLHQLTVAGRMEGPAQKQAAADLEPDVVEVEELSVRLTRTAMAGARRGVEGVQAAVDRLAALEAAYDELDRG